MTFSLPDQSFLWTVAVALVLALSLLAPLGAGLAGASVAPGTVLSGDGSDSTESVPTQSPADVDIDPALEDAADRSGLGTQTAADEPLEVVVRMDAERSAVASPQADTSPDGLKVEARETQQALEAFAEAHDGVEIKTQFWIANAVVLEIDPDDVALEAVAGVSGVDRLHTNFEVERASESALDRTAGAAGSHPSISTPHPTVTTGSTAATYGLEQSNATTVWDEYDTRGAGTTVAVLDTGVDVDNHTDLEAALVEDGWYDTIDGSATPGDVEGHGTHVSGTVVGYQTDSGVHYGVAPEAGLLHAKVLDDAGSGSLEDVLDGLQWALDHDSDVDAVAMSLGAKGYVSAFIEPVQNAREMGVVVVSSSGNKDDGTSTSPGNVYETFAVGSTNDRYEVAQSSSGEEIDTDDAWGDDAPDEWPDEYVVPDVVAPGVGVTSAVPGGEFEKKSGTSMAAPHVAGSVALLRSIDGDLEPDELESVLEGTAWKPDGAPDEQDTRYGHGIIDVHAAALEVTGTGSIAGAVTASGDSSAVSTEDVVSSGEPIENASVTVTNEAGTTWNATTDEDGSYELTALPTSVGPENEYDVTVDAGANYTTETVSGVGVSPNETTTVDVELDYAETGTIEGAVSIDVVGPDETIPVTIESEDDPASEPVELALEHGIESASYTLEDVSLAVDGDERTITASAADYESAAASVSVEPGETTEDVDLGLEREPDTLDGWYNLTHNETNAPVTEGDVLEVDVDVENLAAADTQSVELLADGETVDETDVELEAGEETTITLGYETSDGDSPGVELEVRSDDDSIVTTERVRAGTPATFAVGDIDVAGDQTVNETITVNAIVANDGDLAGSDDVTLVFDGEPVDQQALELEGGESETVSFDYDIPPTPRAGSHDVDVAVESTDDAGETTLEVDYESIASGIAALERDGDGDLVGDGVVRVATGTYDETVTVEESGVTIRGEDASETVLEPAGDVGVAVSGDDVTLSRLTLEPGDGETGVSLTDEASDVTLSRVSVTGTDAATGIDVTDSSGHTIRYGSITGTETGIGLERSADVLVTGPDVEGDDGIVVGDGASETTIRNADLSVSEDALTVASSARSGTLVERNNLVGENASVVVGAELSTAGFATVETSDSSDVDADGNYRDGDVVGEFEDDNEADEPYDSAEFEATFETVPGNVTAGESLEVDVLVENVGDRTGSQDVVFSVGETAVATEDDLELDAGDDETISFSYTPAESDAGAEIDLTVETEDESDERDVEVYERPAFEITDLEAPTNATQGEDVTVTATVKNTGGPGADEIALRIGSDLEQPGSYTQLETDERDLESDQHTSIELTGAVPAEEPTGLRIVGVVTGADADDSFLVVEESEEPENGDDNGDDNGGNGGNGGGGGGDSGGQGGGGGGSGTPHTPAPFPPDDVNVTEDVRSPLRTDASGTSTVTFDRVGQRSAVERITVDEADLVGDVRVREYDRSSSVTGHPPGSTVLAMEILVPRGVESLSATVEFRLDSSAYTTLEADVENVHLARYHDDSWQVLETSVVEETTDGAVFEAETPGFSHFAIVAVGEPTAVASVDPDSVTVGEEATLDGAGSSDRFGEIESFEWTVGDETATGETATVAFDESGEYDVSLTVTNDAGESDTATTTLTVTDPDDGLLTGDGIPGFGLVLAIGAVLAAMGLRARLYRRP
ncbi:S8 family serine peptidase [Natrarchaeobaculum aegyptiacum]|uniref:S8 family serine peptidase n=1 Tax=Natrarchaeobaculum aegyptiacum TaxID=745377 RepID=UPI000A3D7E82|nr:S8 family serine peptidase [Natrarchaeobaculum aegyptiacum]